MDKVNWKTTNPSAGYPFLGFKLRILVQFEMGDWITQRHGDS